MKGNINARLDRRCCCFSATLLFHHYRVATLQRPSDTIEIYDLTEASDHHLVDIIAIIYARHQLSA